MLRVEELQAWYGELHVLHGVDFEVAEGEVVTLLGRNGAGKTTTLRAIMGIVSRCRGSIAFRGTELVGRSSNRIARLGIAYCPEERGIFASLNVEENLLLPPAVLPGGMKLDEIYAIFPNLEERRRSQGTKLSGGEQQMLAIGRILRTGAKLLLFDEPTEGLAPVIVQQIGQVIAALEAARFTILLVEQNFRFAANRRRPPLRRRERPGRRHDPQYRTGGEPGQIARLSRGLRARGEDDEICSTVIGLAAALTLLAVRAPEAPDREATRSRSACSPTCRACTPISAVPDRSRRPRWRLPISAERSTARRSR